MEDNLIYHDWEFLEDGRSIVPISVGMITEAGDEYYAVNADMPWLRVCGHPWLRQHVVPHLPLAGEVGPDRMPVLDLLHPSVKTARQIRQEVRGFILSHPRPKLWGWYSDFDQVALAWLYGPMISLPQGMPMRTSDVQQEIDRLQVPDKELPQQDPDGLHDALSDVRHIRVLHRFLRQLEQQRVQQRQNLSYQMARAAEARMDLQTTRMLALLVSRLGNRVQVSEADLAAVDSDRLVTYRQDQLDQASPLVIEYHPKEVQT